MRRLLAASAFSFFILAAVLFWQGYKLNSGLQGPAQKTRILLCFAGGMVCVVMGAIGTRARHRQHQDEDLD